MVKNPHEQLSDGPNGAARASCWGRPLEAVKPRPWRIKDRLVGGDRPLIMGILNVTPDSFFDGGRHQGTENAIRHAEAMVEAGADILDIGGESSRPGAESVSVEEELARTEPVVRELERRFPAIPISIDTVKFEVGRAALDAGASILNDISAMTRDLRMLELAAPHGAAVVLNHIRGTPKDMQRDPQYSDVVAEVVSFLKERIQALAAFGLTRDYIAVDPGIGFGKGLEHNYRLIEKLHVLDTLGCPILMGMSRKSFLAKTPGLEAGDRLVPSVAMALFAALKGASILRVHDVRETSEALRITEAVREGSTLR